MGKSEITLLIIGIILTIAISSTVAPSFIKTHHFAKTSFVIQDIKSIRDVMNVELSINNGSFNGLNAEKVQDLLKNFNLVGVGNNSYFENKHGIKYNIISNGLNSYFLKIENLEDLDDSEETIIENFKGVFINDLSGNNLKDGILILELDNKFINLFL